MTMKVSLKNLQIRIEDMGSKLTIASRVREDPSHLVRLPIMLSKEHSKICLSVSVHKFSCVCFIPSRNLFYGSRLLCSMIQTERNM